MVTWQNYKFARKQFVVSLIYWDINMTFFFFPDANVNEKFSVIS